MLFKYLIIAILFVGLVFLEGCSSIMSGTTQKLSINSNVQGADVFIDGVNIGKTPLVNARIKRKDTSFLVVKKEGYKEYQQTLLARLDGWFWGNILTYGFGSTTDAAIGTTHLLDPDTLFIQMEPHTGASVSNSSPQDQEIRSFVANSYTSLLKDINNGRGEFLKSLFKLLKIEANDETGITKRLKAIADLYDNIHEFTEAVVKLNSKA
jgi:hypothetical protein